MVDEILQQEAFDSYRFLIDHTNFEDNSPGYGLTLDRASNKIISSIAGSGFMLTSLVIGVVQKWDEYETNLKRAKFTLQNFYKNIPHFEGMFVHYADFNTGKRYNKCEYSTIDTVLFLNGVFTVDSFFDDDEIHYYTRKIYKRINWKKFIFSRNGRKVFRMAYNDIKGGDYLVENELGWIYHWSMYAEQLTMYFLAAGNDRINKNLSKELFLGFERTVGGYSGNNFVYTPGGALFIHQFSHAWFDFQNYYDLTGYDWFVNSQIAVDANYQYCLDQKSKFKTFEHGLWGLSACDGPTGYSGYGAPPFTTYETVKLVNENIKTDGTVALYAIFASLPFRPELVKHTIDKISKNFPSLQGQYGYLDSINLERELWVSSDYLSIDKGITLLMIDNYYNQTTWKYYNKHEVIQKAINKLGFEKKGV